MDNAFTTSLIKAHEGYKLTPYQLDGSWNIGMGFNLSDPSNIIYLNFLGLNAEDIISGKVTLSTQQIDLLTQLVLFDNYNQLVRTYRWVIRFPPNAQAVLMDMLYNMGWSAFNTFQGFLSLIKAGQYADAAHDLLTSEWYKELPHRVQDDANLLMQLGNM